MTFVAPETDIFQRFQGPEIVKNTLVFFQGLKIIKNVERSIMFLYFPFLSFPACMSVYLTYFQGDVNANQNVFVCILCVISNV